MRFNIKCKTCNKLAVEISSKTIGKIVMTKLECGHLELRTLSDVERRADELTVPAMTDSIVTASSPVIEDTRPIYGPENDIHAHMPWNYRKLMPYQKDGVSFGERSNLRLLFADEPGLGKTVQATVLLDRNWDESTPCLITCPPGVTTHWIKFVKEWLQADKFDAKRPHRSIHLHTGRNLPILEGFDIVVIGMHLLSGEQTMQSIREYGFQLFIADECHYFKDERTQRTKAFMEISSFIPKLIALSGTPVMNRVSEYFPVLHALAPMQWPDRRYLNNICDTDYNGKALAISPKHKDWFFQRISKYVIRRTKKDHLPGLPAFRRLEEFIDPEGMDSKAGKKFEAMYNMYLDELQEELSQAHGNILGVISKIRKLTGQFKVAPAFDHAMDILNADDDGTSKLIIGVHHKSVAELLGRMFSDHASENNAPEFNPLFMSGTMNVQEKDAIQEQFKLGKSRVLIASILATAEGRNMQFCHEMMLVEREWNPAKEEQFEQRTHRYGQIHSVTATYFMIRRTIDEWFHSLVELKRNIVNSTFDSQLDLDSSFMRELAELVVRNRMKIVG